MNIQRWEKVADSYIAVDAQNSVVGVLRCLDDTLFIRPPTKSKNRNMEARINMLSDKHKLKDQKRSERRREVKINMRN